MSDKIQQFTQRIGWKRETSDGEDTITSGDPTFYEFGIYTTSWGKFPVLESELKQYFKGLQFNAYQQKVSSTQVDAPISFIPVNGLMFKLIMAREGSGVVHVAGVFRIDGITSGFLDTYVIRFRSDNDQDRIQRSCIGSKFLSLNYNLNFDLPNDPMAAQLVAMARRMDAIKSGSSAANPSQPANSNQFFIDDNTKVLWDVDLTANGQYVAGGTNLDLVPYLISLTQSIDIQTKAAKIMTVHFVSYLTNGNRLFAFRMRLRRTDETSVFDHYVGTTVDGTVGNDDSQAGKSYAGTAAFKNMHFKIFAKDSNGDVVNYIQVDYKDVGIVRIEMNNVDPETDEEAWYDITRIATSGVPTTKDEVPAALYGTS